MQVPSLREKLECTIQITSKKSKIEQDVCSGWHLLFTKTGGDQNSRAGVLNRVFEGRVSTLYHLCYVAGLSSSLTLCKIWKQEEEVWIVMEKYPHAGDLADRKAFKVDH